MDGKVYCSGDDGTHGSQLWVSDATPQGTHMVVQLNGTTGVHASNLTAVGKTLYFTGLNAAKTYQLWSSDGTPGGTRVLSSFPDGASIVPQHLMPFGNALLFSQSTQLWTYLPP